MLNFIFLQQLATELCNTFITIFRFVSALAMVIMSLDGVGCSRGTVFYPCYHLLCILWSQGVVSLLQSS